MAKPSPFGLENKGDLCSAVDSLPGARGRTIISVAPNEKNSNPQQKAVNKLLKEANLRAWHCVSIARLYALEGPLTQEEIKCAARELFTDPVIEKFSLNSKPGRPRFFFSDIWFKKGVTDPAAESILKALRDLEIHRFLRVFSGTRYEFFCKNGSASHPLLKKQLAEFVTLHLLNPLIQECRIIPPPALPPTKLEGKGNAVPTGVGRKSGGGIQTYGQGSGD